MNNDLISRSALLEKMSIEFFETDPRGEEQLGFLKCTRLTRTAPAVDAEPVRHGRWDSEVVKCRDWKGIQRDYFQPYSCSVCHKPDSNQGKSNYCPNCGAKMDAEVEG